jgi:hypothetical protein
VALHFVDPNVLPGGEDAPLQEGETRLTLLHHLVEMADPSDDSTREKQRIIVEQLIENGANVNAVSILHGRTPLHIACSGVTEKRCRPKFDVYYQACSRCGHISAELAYRGCQYYHSIWSVLPGQG